MIEQKFFCDLCGKELDIDRDAIYPLQFKIFVSQNNPLGELCGNYQNANIEYSDTCDECRAEVALLIKSWIKNKLYNNKKVV